MGKRGRVVVGRVGERGRVVGVMDQAAAPGTPSGGRTTRKCSGTRERGSVVVAVDQAAAAGTPSARRTARECVGTGERGRVVVVMDQAQFTFGTWRSPRSEGKPRDGPNGIDVTNKETKVPCLTELTLQSRKQM